MRSALPQPCALCLAPCGHALLCVACANQLPWLREACPRCALPSPGGITCVRCRARPPPWTRAQAAFAYAYPLDRLVHALKYRGALAYAPLLADALAQAVAPSAEPARIAPPDVLVALPLAPSRQRERGYNQALEIARPLGHRLGIPLMAALVRTRDTPPLAAMPWRERQRAMAGAFTATQPMRGMRLAVIDDVLTTGATLRAATLALRAAGAVAVEVWVVARTLSPAADGTRRWPSSEGELRTLAPP